MAPEQNTLRTKRSSIAGPALRGAILAAPMIAALLAVYAASGSDNRLSLAIDKTITGSITTAR